jgi:hypothetical protein
VKIGSVKIGRVRIGARHAWLDEHWPDKQIGFRALRPVRVLLLSVIAGMAHSTLKSGAATRNGVAFGYQLKVRRLQARSHSAEGPRSSHRLTRQRMWQITLAIRCEWINGRIRNDNGWAARGDRTRNFEPSANPF